MAAVETVPDAQVRLLRAAERLFAEKGYAATSVHEITDAAGTNRALLYYYFEDKHSLYRSLIADGVVEFTRMLDDALSDPGSYSEKLAAVVRGYLNLIWNRHHMSRVVHRCLLDGHQEEVGLVAGFRGCVERLEAFFRDAAAAGEFREVDPAIMARAFLGPSYIFSLWKLYEALPYTPDQLAEHVTAFVLRGVRA